MLSVTRQLLHTETLMSGIIHVYFKQKKNGHMGITNNEQFNERA